MADMVLPLLLQMTKSYKNKADRKHSDIEITVHQMLRNTAGKKDHSAARTKARPYTSLARHDHPALVQCTVLHARHGTDMR